MLLHAVACSTAIYGHYRPCVLLRFYIRLYTIHRNRLLVNIFKGKMTNVYTYITNIHRWACAVYMSNCRPTTFKNYFLNNTFHVAIKGLVVITMTTYHAKGYCSKIQVRALCSQICIGRHYC